MTFIEKLSCILGKQYIFKQHSDCYYNRYIHKYQNKKEVKEWLLEILQDNIEESDIS